MTQNNIQVGYSSIIFYSFSCAFCILGAVNSAFPLSNYKMIILSVVALLLSIQQLYEAKEEMEEKITDMKKRASNQANLISLIDHAKTSHQEVNHSKSGVAKSRMVFAIAIITMLVGLSLDLNFENTAIANTSTILSFAAIFLTMGFKDQFSTRINEINEQLFVDDQRIITQMKARISTLEKSIDESELSDK